MYLLTAVMLWNLRKDVIKTVYFHPLRIFRKIVSMVGENRKGGIQNQRGIPVIVTVEVKHFKFSAKGKK